MEYIPRSGEKILLAFIYKRKVIKVVFFYLILFNGT